MKGVCIEEFVIFLSQNEKKYMLRTLPQCLGVYQNKSLVLSPTPPLSAVNPKSTGKKNFQNKKLAR